MKARLSPDRPLGAIFVKDGRTLRLCPRCGCEMVARQGRKAGLCQDCRDVERGLHWKPRRRESK